MWKCLLAFAALSNLLGAASCIGVDGNQIVAGDVAKIDPAFASLSPDLPFSYAPMPGSRRIIPASEIAKWGATAGVEARDSDSICFERLSRSLSSADVTAAIKQAFPKIDFVQIDVLEVCKCSAPSGVLKFSPEGASAPPPGHADVPVIWRGEIIPESGPAYPVWARVRVLAKSVGVRARQSLRTRDVLKAEALEQVELIDSPLRLRQPDCPANYVGKIVNRDIRAGAYLDPSFITPPPDVSRGSTVTVEVVNGATRLELKARAETAGSAGDTVLVTNPSGLRRFRAVVTGPGLVQIALSPSASLDQREKNGGMPTTISKGTL